jgi:hypothetical protein
VSKLDTSLTNDELEAYLTAQRTIRLATVSPGGEPNVIPLWFVWLDGAVFMNTTLGNVTVANLEANPAAAGVVDDGDGYGELRGAVLRGHVLRAEGDQRLGAVRERWSQKYLFGNPVPFDRWSDRVWLRLVPSDIASWDFRKIPEARARAKVREAGG